MRGTSTPLKALWLLVPVVPIYASYLGQAPVYLFNTEVLFALHAHSIASTAHDANGRFLPLYFQMRPIGENVWFQPVLVYFAALFLKVLPLSESTIRLPTVIVGLTDIVLMYFVAKRIFKREFPAIVASALLALTPAHVITSRFAMDYLYPVPFLLGWLLCLVTFVERQHTWLLFAGTSLLGLGVYSYLAAVVMMPWYFVLTCLVLFLEHKASARVYLAALTGFVWPLLLSIPWLLTHPTYLDTVGRYGAVKLLGESLHFFAITDRINIYWSFFNPSYLFLTGGVDVMASTRRVGVFLIPMIVFFLTGANQIVNTRPTPTNLLILVGFLSAPLAALIPAEAYALDRELEVLPFGVLVATFGVVCLLAARHRLARLIGICALVLMPIQFCLFYFDYLTDYRVRSSGWFGNNIGGALEAIITQDEQKRAPAIYLSTKAAYVDSYWRFYLIKHDRQELLARTTYVEPGMLDARAVPAGSLILSDHGGPYGEALATSGELRMVKRITEPNNNPSFAVFEK